jgi:uncharacterized protein YcgI (DUF1989 family)
MKRGEVLRVVDPQGEQVSDLFAFAADKPHCSLSSGRTIDYARKNLVRAFAPSEWIHDLQHLQARRSDSRRTVTVKPRKAHDSIGALERL